MTDVTQLAERIIKICSGGVTPDLDQIGVMDMLESLLREAMGEAKKQADVYLPIDKDSVLGSMLLKQAKDEAYTRAAEVVRKRINPDNTELGEQIAAAIEKLREETK